MDESQTQGPQRLPSEMARLMASESSVTPGGVSFDLSWIYFNVYHRLFGVSEAYCEIIIATHTDRAVILNVAEDFVAVWVRVESRNAFARHVVHPEAIGSPDSQ